jgi:hypothetical protein
MNLEQFAYLAQIIGTVLVVASLVYVARQLRQNADALRAQSRQASLANDKVSIQTAIDERAMFELLARPEPLSFQDQFRFSMVMIMTLRDREHEFFQYKAGVLDDAAWHSYREVIRITLDSERRRKWWASVGSEFLDPSFRLMVNEIIADSPLNDTFTRFGSWE